MMLEEDSGSQESEVQPGSEQRDLEHNAGPGLSGIQERIVLVF
jgi:hypothetical protein